MTRQANPLPTANFGEPNWMLLDVRWDPDWRACERPGCGTLHKRTYFVEESSTGNRMHVGKTCWYRLNEPEKAPHSHDLVVEVRLSDCASGCKVYRCGCGTEQVHHSATYGCRGGA